jgi:hypothetical protein
MRGILPIRLSSSERATLERAAVLQELALSAYIRRAALQLAELELDRAEAVPVVRQREPVPPEPDPEPSMPWWKREGLVDGLGAGGDIRRIGDDFAA